ncbi:MAG: EAL domain-containing protein [Gammaproteobacteria bacterium]|nr:EAL domain-containing protein [Gammaproteobacteria bacterium]
MNANMQQTVLIVDDIEANITLLQRILSRLDINIITASDGEHAIELTNNHDVSLILLDVNMPRMSGFEVAEQLAIIYSENPIPIIFITASDEHKKDIYRLKGYEYGALDYILKPFNNHVLLAKVKVILRLREQEKKLITQNQQLQDEINHRHEIEQTLREQQRELLIAANAFEYGMASIITDDKGNILRANPDFTAVTGYSEQEVLGKNPSILQSGRHDSAFYKKMWHQIDSQGIWQGEIWNQRKNGEIYVQYQTIIKIIDSEGQVLNYIAAFTDITEKKEREDHIHYLAHYDSLTGLPNRPLFTELFTKELSRTKRTNQSGAILFLDLNRFKNINDSLGHQVGDEVLIEFANRLLRCLRKEDTVARISGDEFIILIANVNGNLDAAASIAKAISQKIIQSLHAPMEIGPHEIIASTSIGISLFPNNDLPVETIIKQADTALYSAKEDGWENVKFFDSEMEVTATHRLHIEIALRKAVENQDLQIYFQPKFNIQTGSITGAEALLRWHHEEDGFISPSDFIPIAEGTGLIVKISEWLLDSVCKQIQKWEQQQLFDGIQNVSVNISPRHFRQQDFVEKLIALVKYYDISPAHLELELTEDIITTNVADVRNKLEIINECGIKISIDNFGTGYSSLTYLQQLPIHSLKIDRSFINDIDENSEHKALIHAIMSMANTFHLNTVAEGVETVQQQDYLQQQGCMEFQGFLRSPAISLDKFNDMLQQKKTEHS